MVFLVWTTIVTLLVLLLHARSDEHHQYQAIIDSGSTGSRIYIYRYQPDAPLQTIEELHSKRINPALATFFNDKDGLCEYLQSLMSYAARKIDPEYHSLTAISLKATAGLRTIPAVERDWIMTEVRSILQNSSFRYDPSETRVLTGGEEALFGLLATNIAFSNLTSKLELSLGAGDLGGSSQQVAFVVPPKTFLQSLFDAYLQPFGKWSSVSKTDGVILSEDNNNNNSNTNPSTIEKKSEDDITDECLPNFAVTFPVPPSGGVMSAFFAPFAALASSYSPATLLSNTRWLPSELIRGILSKPKLSSTISSHPALHSAFFSSTYGSSVTINIYAKSMASMGLVAAMNETFYHIAETHQKRITARKLLTQQEERLEEEQRLRLLKQEEMDNFHGTNESDAHICHSSLDLSDENVRYCHGKWDFSVTENTDTLDHSAEAHTEEIETTENNDGSHLYGEHASWLHTLRDTDEILENPCAPPGENLPYPDALSTLRWQGTGDFESCTQYVRHLIETHAVRDKRCLQQWQSQLPTSFIMMDNFPKVLQVMELPVDQLNASLTPAMVRIRGRDICHQPWTELQDLYPDYPAYRVQQVCFAASFMYVLMTDVYGLAEGDWSDALLQLSQPSWRQEQKDSAEIDKVSALNSELIFSHAEDIRTDEVTAVSQQTTTVTALVEKSISPIRFVAMDSHDSFTIGWSLGAAIISAMNITYSEELDGLSLPEIKANSVSAETSSSTAAVLSAVATARGNEPEDFDDDHESNVVVDDFTVETLMTTHSSDYEEMEDDKEDL